MKRRPIPTAWITTPALIVLFIAAWHLYVAWSGVSKFIIPPPLAVWESLVDLLGTASTLRHAWITLYETLVGFFFACIIGVGLGTVLGKTAWLEQALNPFIIATQVVPKVALVPLFILWFGFGTESKIVVATVLAFFPILTNTVLGIKSVDSGHNDVMTVLNAGRWQRFITLELPSSLPAVLAGMEVGIVLAIIGAVVGEYLGGSTGLGHLAVASLNDYKVGMMFAVIILLTAMGFLLYLLVGALKKLLIPWHDSVASKIRPVAG
ncbi:MAG: ABC transporter permease [Betaproteobacteria bacterium]|nr:MAG: ABC transporter permease [Betaproteobacteria bacterium]